MVSMDSSSSGGGHTNYHRGQHSWFPYEHDSEDYRCKLTCFSREQGTQQTEEYYQTGENVVDGTSCSYDCLLYTSPSPRDS